MWPVVLIVDPSVRIVTGMRPHASTSGIRVQYVQRIAQMLAGCTGSVNGRIRVYDLCMIWTIGY
jgi:hypothetical protein